MAEHSKIIEFFGVPACGKTTLKKTLLNYNNNLFSSNFRTLTGLKCFLSFFRVSSWEMLFYGYLVYLKSGYSKNPFSIMAWRWLRCLLRLRYAVEKNPCKYIAVDNGLIQTLVTFQRGRNLHKQTDYFRLVERFLTKTVKMLSIQFVFCEIDLDLALDRIEKRNRGSGRLDTMSANQRKQEYRDEYERFCFFADYLKSKHSNCITISMNCSTQDSVKSLLQGLGEDSFNG